MDNQFEPLSIGEVLSVNESAEILIGHRTFRVGEFAEAIRTQLEYGIAGWNKDKNAWFSKDGIPCEVLRFNSQGWQKGKVRINLEFCPQEFEDQEESLEQGFAENFEATPVAESSDELDFSEVSLGDENEEDELDLGAVGATAFDEQLYSAEPETEFSVEMEQEDVTTADYDFDLNQTSTDLDEEFDLEGVEESIEQDLEFFGEPDAGDEELGDFGEMPQESDEEMDFGDISPDTDQDFDFNDISSNFDNEAEDADPLLNDVWQDLNEVNRQNN